jgi:hypothetical protein
MFSIDMHECDGASRPRRSDAREVFDEDEGETQNDKAGAIDPRARSPSGHSAPFAVEEVSGIVRFSCTSNLSSRDVMLDSCRITTIDMSTQGTASLSMTT